MSSFLDILAARMKTSMAGRWLAPTVVFSCFVPEIQSGKSINMRLIDGYQLEDLGSTLLLQSAISPAVMFIETLSTGF